MSSSDSSAARLNGARALRRSFAGVTMLLSAVTLVGCGFQPIAGGPAAIGVNGETPTSRISLRDLKIDAPESRFIYYLRRELLKYAPIDSASPFTLVLKSRITSEGLAIEQDDEITRVNFRATTAFVLTIGEGEDAKERRGSTQALSAVDNTSDQFTAFINQRDVVERLAVETARRMITILRLEANALDDAAG